MYRIKFKVNATIDTWNPSTRDYVKKEYRTGKTYYAKEIKYKTKVLDILLQYNMKIRCAKTAIVSIEEMTEREEYELKKSQGIKIRRPYQRRKNS